MSGETWATFVGEVKAFCPCDAGRPEDCKPEEWRPAHAPSSCERCGRPNYQHLSDGAYTGVYCRDPEDPRRRWDLNK